MNSLQRVIKVDIESRNISLKTRMQLARTLIAAIDGGSISEGARALNITRSAASKNIAALEASLGTQLLMRNSKSLTLTEAGEVYVGPTAPNVHRWGL